MGVDRVGLAFGAPSSAIGLLALDHVQAGCGDRAGQPQPVAAGSFDRHHQSWAGGVIDDPGQQLRVAGGVVGDRAGGDRDAVRVGDLYLVGVAVGVDTDDGVDEFCQHGHRSGPSCGGSGSTSAPAWVGVTERHICDGSRPCGGQASDQANWWARPVSVSTTDESGPGHAEAARSFASHAETPTPSLVVLHPGAPQRHSQIFRGQDVGDRHRSVPMFGV